MNEPSSFIPLNANTVKRIRVIVWRTSDDALSLLADEASGPNRFDIGVGSGDARRLLNNRMNAMWFLADFFIAAENIPRESVDCTNPEPFVVEIMKRFGLPHPMTLPVQFGPLPDYLVDVISAVQYYTRCDFTGMQVTEMGDELRFDCTR